MESEPKEKKWYDHQGPNFANGDIPWRAWGSWFSWGSPVGMSIFILAIGAFLVLLHLAGLIK